MVATRVAIQPSPRITMAIPTLDLAITAETPTMATRARAAAAQVEREFTLTVTKTPARVARAYPLTLADTCNTTPVVVAVERNKVIIGQMGA